MMIYQGFTDPYELGACSILRIKKHRYQLGRIQMLVLTSQIQKCTFSRLRLIVSLFNRVNRLIGALLAGPELLSHIEANTKYFRLIGSSA